MNRLDIGIVAEEAIRLRDAYVASGRYATFAGINCGGCDSFAHDLRTAVKERTGIEMDELDIGGFQLTDPVTGCVEEDGAPFDRDLMARHWRGIRPAEGLDWDDMDELSAAAGFNPGTHVFLHAEGLFFDAEAPGGVPNVFDLPFFGRVIESWCAERAPSP